MDFKNDAKIEMDSKDQQLRDLIRSVIDQGTMTPKQVGYEIGVSHERALQLYGNDDRTIPGERVIKGLLASSSKDSVLAIGACEILSPHLVHGPRTSSYITDTNGDGVVDGCDSQTIVARIQSELGDVAMGVAGLRKVLKNNNELGAGHSLAVRKDVRELKQHLNGLLQLLTEWDGNGENRKQAKRLSIAGGAS